MQIKMPAGIIQDINDAYGFDLELRSDYSGRGMYGKTCFGVVGSKSSCTQFFMRLYAELLANDEDSAEDFIEIFDNLCIDNMGLDVIYYIPGLEIEGEFDE